MELEEAGRRIAEVFPTEAGSKDTLSDEESLDLLDAMEAPIRSAWRGPRDSLATFLFYTCAKFDRWDAPSPVVVPPSYPDQFERALSLFRLVEDQRSEFVALFELHGLQTKLYQDAAIVPGRARTGHCDVEEYRRRLSEIPAPTMPQQRLEYTARRIRLERLLNGIEKANSCQSAHSGRTRFTDTAKLIHLLPKWNKALMFGPQRRGLCRDDPHHTETTSRAAMKLTTRSLTIGTVLTSRDQANQRVSANP